MADLDEQAAVLALVWATEGEWYRTATLIEAAESALRVLRRDWNGLEPFDVEKAERLSARVTAESLERSKRFIAELRGRGITILTVLDDSYPVNLRFVYNRPPVLFVQGSLLEEDNRAVAVVGTRLPSQEGLRQAKRLARELARNGVTVLSGLALGIDTAAHEAALDARGRTVAVMGTGIDRVYPPTNASLAQRIAGQGALVSQFMPDAPPTRYSFPLRNVVMSGMAVGTVVVEAGSTSGAKMQARFALEHGKRLFLLDSLVTRQEWAQRYARHPGSTVVKSVDDILEVLVSLAKPVKQLALG